MLKPVSRTMDTGRQGSSPPLGSDSKVGMADLALMLQAGTVKSGLYDPNPRVSHCLLRPCAWLFLVALALILGHMLPGVGWVGQEQVSSGSNSQGACRA